MKEYFILVQDDLKMIVWGERDDTLESIPVVIAPIAMPLDVLEECLETIKRKDPDGKIGTDIEAYVEEASKNAPPEDIFTDPALNQGVVDTGDTP